MTERNVDIDMKKTAYGIIDNSCFTDLPNWNISPKKDTCRDEIFKILKDIKKNPYVTKLKHKTI